jgi:peptidoglycan/xylan/chitin deacetylase (PgdA/CDA1 family)
MSDGIDAVLSGTPRLAPRSVALTFDDGPGPKSAQLARMLRDEGVSATFFVLGESVERYGEVLAGHLAHGHSIGLHGQQHEPFVSAQVAADQLRMCRERVVAQVGEAALGPRAWFRPPYGEGVGPVAGFAGPVGWHAHGRDWDITYRRGQTVVGCVDEVVGSLRRSEGGVVLLHDFAPHTEFTADGLTESDLDLRVLDVTSLLLERLRREGFALVALPAPPPVGAAA